MRAFQTAFFASILSLSDKVLAIPAVSTTASAISTTPISTKTVPVSNLATIINTIDVSSFLTSFSSVRRTSTLGAASTTASPPSMSSNSTLTQTDTSNGISHQNLVIILCAVLGSLGLILLLGAIFLLNRFSRGKRPFGHRGASPINDDEIESWRTSGREKHVLPPPAYGPGIRDVPLHSPGWTWTASPSSIRTISAHVTEPQLIMPRAVEPHAVLAKAPNARAGLTDEALPGEDPFITPPKRQSSRLSKPPPGHGRTKSRRSSMSAKSTWSGRERVSSEFKAKDHHTPWYDDEFKNTHAELDHDVESPSRADFFDNLPSGGLSPRPKSIPRIPQWEVRSEDIGRAIA